MNQIFNGGPTDLICKLATAQLLSGEHTQAVGRKLPDVAQWRVEDGHISLAFATSEDAKEFHCLLKRDDLNRFGLLVESFVHNLIRISGTRFDSLKWRITLGSHKCPSTIASVHSFLDVLVQKDVLVHLDISESSKTEFPVSPGIVREVEEIISDYFDNDCDTEEV
jgi:hypothetical protein